MEVKFASLKGASGNLSKLNFTSSGGWAKGRKPLLSLEVEGNVLMSNFFTTAVTPPCLTVSQVNFFSAVKTIGTLTGLL